MEKSTSMECWVSFLLLWHRDKSQLLWHHFTYFFSVSTQQMSCINVLILYKTICTISDWKMSQASNSSDSASLKGKRKKKVPPPHSANPLFVKWLTEWRDEAVEKGWKSSHTYSKVILFDHWLIKTVGLYSFVLFNKCN